MVTVTDPERDPARSDPDLPFTVGASASAGSGPPSDVTSIAEVDDLRAVPLFQSLSDANLCTLAQSVIKRHASAGDILCREGDPGHEMYVVLKGTVTLNKAVGDREPEIRRLESGSHFGEMALIGEAPRTGT